MGMAEGLLRLPNELLLVVADTFDGLRDLNAFARTNRHLYFLLNSTLYSFDYRTGQDIALSWAARNGSERTAQLSLAEGVAVETIRTPRASEPRFPGVVDSNFPGKLTPLQAALVYKHENVARLLVERGADVRRLYPEPAKKLTPLHVASALGFVTIVRMLIDRGARLETRDKRGWTALHYAVKGNKLCSRTQGNVETVELLMERGAMCTIRDTNDRTPEDLSTRNRYFFSKVNRTDRVMTPERYADPGCVVRWSEEDVQHDASVAMKIKRIFESKRATLVAEQWEKDRQSRRKKRKVQEQSLKDRAMRDRKAIDLQRKDQAVRNAEKKEAERQALEAARIEAEEVEVVRREAERLHLVETDRAERQAAIGINWARLREKAELTTSVANIDSSVSMTSCKHALGRLKSKRKGQCEKCEKTCRQYSHICPDCGSMICAQCL